MRNGRLHLILLISALGMFALLGCHTAARFGSESKPQATPPVLDFDTVRVIAWNVETGLPSVYQPLLQKNGFFLQSMNNAAPPNTMTFTNLGAANGPTVTLSFTFEGGGQIVTTYETPGMDEYQTWVSKLKSGYMGFKWQSTNYADDTYSNSQGLVTQAVVGPVYTTNNLVTTLQQPTMWELSFSAHAPTSDERKNAVAK